MSAGVEISLRIGQRVRHHDYKGQRVTGVIRSISVDSDRALMCDIWLDAPIVIPADVHGPAVEIRSQYVPAHELQEFDDSHELIAEMLAALQLAEREMTAMRAANGSGVITSIAIESARAAIAKATGSAS